MLAERLYTYPRHLTWPLELLSGLLAGFGIFSAGQAILDYWLTRHPLSPQLLKEIPALRAVAYWIMNYRSGTPTVQSVIGALAMLGLMLVLSILLRDALPAVRTSARGVLIRFGGDWLPVRWDGVQALRITENGDKFVALVQIEPKRLTVWHRFWSFLYRFGWRRGFLVTSAMTHAEDLMRELADELQRRQKLGQSTAEIDDKHRSPLFAPLLRAPKPERAMTASPVAAALSQPAAAATATGITYSSAVSRGLFFCSTAIAGLAAWQYIHAWMTFLIFTFPSIRRISFFGTMDVPAVYSTWGLLIGAHVGLLLVAGVITLLYHLFPLVAADTTGLHITVLGKSRHVPWSAVKVVKATAVDEDRHVVLIEAAVTALPWWYRIGSWLYDHGASRGAIVWPMARGFETLMQRIALELSRQGNADEATGPRLRDDAPGWLLLLALKPAQALDRLVVVDEATDEEAAPDRIDRARAMRGMLPMLSLAAGPTLVLLAHWVLFRGMVFSFQIPATLLVGLIWGLAEWPLASMVAQSVDQMVGTGTKGYTGLYLYPTAQLPRLLPICLAMLLMLLGFSNLALVALALSIAWSCILTAGLWEALYGWHGVPLAAGAATTVGFQLLTLLGIVALR